ncbi:nickel ABC transporter ATP-binding protein NikE [Sphingomonas bacterium]|uniref:nickel ABC transporter ATP-binding protein NikE n=1 Tax=Sphingomonas bacterium TaxID=1895847 RepID=UPI001575709D|nr:ABC transporter ATP-binding protein [Sphingomonas bacterium]
MSLLEIAGLGVAFGDHCALDGVALTLAAGEILGIVGASGSGKSTLALAAVDLLPEGAVREGTIRFDGRALDALGERGRDALRGAEIGLIFQDPAAALDPLWTIGAQVAEAIRVHRRCSRREARDRAAETLARCGLDPAEAPPSRYPHQLSGGQRQRVGIAIAIANRPRLLIADEPATALDAVTQANILALLRGLVAEDGMALLLISHDLALVAGIADSIAVMRDGRIIETGPTAALLADPATGYARDLVSAAAARDTVPAAGKTEEREPLLEVEHLSFAYPARRRRFHADAPMLAVADVGFAIARGEIVGLVGASGSGKSSLIRLILALARPQAGEVRIGDASLTFAKGRVLRRRRRRVQGVFQHPRASFDPRFRVHAIVTEPLALLDRDEARAGRVDRALERVGLSAALAERYPHQLSGGERQRVAIARAIVLEPALVVLDEATSALDPISRAGIFALIERLSREQGIAFLIATHDLAMLRGFADRLLVMEAGRIVEQGETGRLLGNPRHPHTTALIAATPELRP